LRPSRPASTRLPSSCGHGSSPSRPASCRSHHLFGRFHSPHYNVRQRVGKLVVPRRMVGTAEGRPTSFSSVSCCRSPVVPAPTPANFILSESALRDMGIEEGSMDGKHLVVTCTLSDCENKIPTKSLIDCEATRFSFIGENFVRQHNLPMFKLRVPRTLEVIDGRPIFSREITHIVKVGLTIGQHHEPLPAFVITLAHYPLVLGIPWLRHHDVSIRFASNTVTFDSGYCKTHC
jgi:hypothetical protein